MQKKRHTALLFVLSILCGWDTLSAAQSGDAGQPGEFLRYGVGGRALGMGHAFTGLANDASAVYWNAAGLMTMGRSGFTSMYTNLFVDSRYSFMSVALPRTLIGANNAVGFGWVNLNMADFDQRSWNNIKLGDFDYYEQAFLLSGAREFVSTWGILNYGLNLKVINQAFPGYISENGSAAQGWGFGADVGVTFRPINAPLLAFVPLRLLLPLQIGVSLQNVLPPRVGIGGGEKDIYPFIFRWGASYDLLVDDWRFTLLYDQEYFADRDFGHFFGAEALCPAPFAGTVPTLRAGMNSRSKAPSFGAGLKLDYLANAAIRIDFAYALKPHALLENDFRLFLTIDFGRVYDAAYFSARAAEQQRDRQKLADHLQVLTRFHEDEERAVESALLLLNIYDQNNRDRYFDFVGGRYKLPWLFQKILQMSENSNDPAIREKLTKFALEIIEIIEERE